MRASVQKEAVEAFLAAVGPMRTAYTNIRLSFLAIKEGNHSEFVIRRARIFCSTGSTSLKDREYQSESVYAGNLGLETLGYSLEDIIEQAIAGELRGLAFPIRFFVRQAQTNLFHVEEQFRYSVMSLYGDGSFDRDQQNTVDWELKAAATPYDSVQELAFDFGLGPIQSGAGPIIDFIAYNVIAIDAQSIVQGEKAKILVRVANGLSKESVRVSYREFKQGAVLARTSIPFSGFVWSEEGELYIGSAEIRVSPAAALHCTASYAGWVQHQFWVADPETAQNYKRVAYEIIDPNLAALRDSFQREDYRGRNARELESNVSWLLWMLGFSVAHFGETKRAQDAVDILATTPQGHFAVIECTTGLLRVDSKIPKLIDRSESLRRRLEASGNHHLHVITIIVTTKARDEIRAELEQAEKHSILVVCREDIESAINNTLIHQDADILFERARKTIQENIGKYENPHQLQLSLPGKMN